MTSENKQIYEVISEELQMSLKLTLCTRQKFDNLLMRVILIWNLNHYWMFGFYYYRNNTKIWIDASKSSPQSLWQQHYQSQITSSTVIYLALVTYPINFTMATQMTYFSDNELKILCVTLHKYLTINRTNPKFTKLEAWQNILDLGKCFEHSSLDSSITSSCEHKLSLVQRELEFLNLIGQNNIETFFVQQKCKYKIGGKRKYRPIEIILNINQLLFNGDISSNIKTSYSWDYVSLLKTDKRIIKLELLEKENEIVSKKTTIELFLEDLSQTNQLSYIIEKLRENYVIWTEKLSVHNEQELIKKYRTQDRENLELICSLQKSLTESQDIIEGQNREIEQLEREKNIIKEMQQHITEVFEERLENLRREISVLTHELEKKNQTLENIKKRFKSQTPVPTRRHFSYSTTKPESNKEMSEIEKSEQGGGRYVKRRTTMPRKLQNENKKNTEELELELSHESVHYNSFLQLGESGSGIGF